MYRVLYCIKYYTVSTQSAFISFSSFQQTYAEGTTSGGTPSCFTGLDGESSDTPILLQIALMTEWGIHIMHPHPHYDIILYVKVVSS